MLNNISNNQQIFYIALAVFVIFMAILFGLNIYYLTRKRIVEGEGEGEDEKEEEEKERKENDIVSLKFSEEFIEELKNVITKEIKKTTSEINKKIADETLGLYKEITNQLSRETKDKINNWDREVKEEISKLGNVSSQTQNSIIEETKKTIKKINEGIDGKINIIYQVALEALGKKIVKTEQEIENHKKERLKEIDKKIYQIVEEVVKKTIGKTIDVSIHEELVMDALERAKKEKFI